MKILQPLRHALGLTQKALGDIVGVTQQAVQAAEQRDGMPKGWADLLREALPAKQPVIDAHLSGAATGPPDAGAPVIADDEPVLDSRSVEEEARGWVEEFRTSVLLERLRHHARDHGLVPQRVQKYPWMLYLGPPPPNRGRRPHAMRGRPLLFASVRSFGIPAATLIGIGSPYKHAVVSSLLVAFSKELGTDLRFHPGSRSDPAERPIFLGYITAINTLFVNRAPHHSLRYISLDDEVVYQDCGVVVYGPPGKATNAIADVLPQDARQVAFVCGAHRLSSGAATRLLEDGDLQARVLGQRLDFSRCGGFAFRITRASGPFTSKDQFDIIWRSDPRPPGRQAGRTPR